MRRWTLAGIAAACALFLGALLLRTRVYEVRPPPEARHPLALEDRRPEAPLPSPAPTREPTSPATAREAENPAIEDALAHPTGTLRVIVRDSWDRPVRQVRVKAYAPGTGEKFVSGSRQADGAVEVRLPLGVPHRLQVDPSGPSHEKLLGSATQEPVYADWGQVTVRLPTKCCRMSGRVVAAETREPLPSVTVLIEGSEYSNSAAGMGGEEFDLLVPAGDVTFAASAAGREPETRSFRLGVGEWLRDVEIPLARIPRGVLDGRVVNAEGVPVRGAQVFLAFLGPHRLGRARVEYVSRLGEVRTEADGRFTFGDVPLGKNALDVRAEGYEPTGGRFRVRGAREEIEVVLARAGRMRVRGLDPGGSVVTPVEVVLRKAGEVALRVPGAWVEREGRRFEIRGTVERDTEGQWGVEAERPTVHDDGFLVIEGVPPGKYEVTVSADRWEGRSEAVVAEGETAEVEVRVTETARPR